MHGKTGTVNICDLWFNIFMHRKAVLLYTHVRMKVKHCHTCNFCRDHNQKLNDDNSNKQYDNGHKHCTKKYSNNLTKPKGSANMIVIFSVHYYDPAIVPVCAHTSPTSPHAHTDIHAGRINTYKHICICLPISVEICHLIPNDGC